MEIKLLGLTKDNNSVGEWEYSVEMESTCRRRKLHRVPPQLRENKKYIYDPMVLSFGPYHHGGVQFRQVEQLKEEVLHKMVEHSNVKGLFRSKILERVDEIRNFYGGLETNEYDDDALAEMMLRDAYFLLCYIQLVASDIYIEYLSLFIDRVGRSGMSFMDPDFYMLENQIPFWVIKLLISLTFRDKDKEEALLCKLLSFVGDRRISRVPWEHQEEPLHLIEAYRATTLVKEESGTIIEPRSRIFKFKWWGSNRSSTNNEYDMYNANSPYRSVAELKAKGIHFGPSSNCLQDIRFNSYSFYGKLQLPICSVTTNSKVFFSNIIAFETSPETHTDCAVTSYVNFMKTLIESTKDVKELREKGILFSSLPNDEDVVRIFKEIDTCGTNNDDIFQNVKMRIKTHCASKAKTWMAELAETYFGSPWNVIALFAASYLLILATLQTYYTMNPK